MALFEWENGTKTQNAVVTGDGVTVQDALWEGETPISASNLNSAQNQLVETVEKDINTNLGTETNSWSSASSYSINDRVIYAGGIYRNITGNNSSAPSTDTTNWAKVPIVSNGYFNSDLVKEKVLYSDATGSTSSVTLTESALNYRKIVIEWKANQYPEFLGTQYTEVFNPANTTYTFSNSFWNADNTRIYVVNTAYTVNDDVITISQNKSGAVSANSAYGGAVNVMAITKVIGYN